MKEIVARFQMRDSIMIAYLAGVGTLGGYGLAEGHGQFLQYLLIFLPFLALGGISIVAQHQDQVTAYYQYFSSELRASLSVPEREVPVFFTSRAAQEHTPHMLRMLFISQLTLFCGPSLFAIILNAPYFQSSWAQKETLLIAGILLTFFTGWRVWSSKQYRRKVMEELFKAETGDSVGE